MGLDVTAYRKLQAAGSQDRNENGFPLAGDDAVSVYCNPDFPGRCDEFAHHLIVVTEEPTIDFNAGSYGGYNAWREKLAKLAGYALGSIEDHGAVIASHAATVWKNPCPGPFMELISFSDCEGFIGTAVSTKLAADFAAFQSKADEHSDEYFRRKYAEWRAAFEYASDGGAVQFN